MRGTRWAGLQAVTEYVDHFAQTRSGDRDAAAQRASRAIFSTYAVRQNAYNLFAVAASN